MPALRHIDSSRTHSGHPSSTGFVGLQRIDQNRKPFAVGCAGIGGVDRRLSTKFTYVFRWRDDRIRKAHDVEFVEIRSGCVANLNDRRLAKQFRRIKIFIVLMLFEVSRSIFVIVPRSSGKFKRIASLLFSSPRSDSYAKSTHITVSINLLDISSYRSLH